MKRIKKLFILTLALVIALSTLSFGACNTQKGDLILETINSPFVSVTAYAEESATGVLTRKLTATIYPENAFDKSVDWSVAWEEEETIADVRNYLTVTPDSDGSCKATATCIQAFEGNIIITVRTRVGGHIARCVAKFVGKPTSLDIVENNGTYVLENGKSIYQLPTNSTFTWDLKLDNQLNVVGESYKDPQKFSLSLEVSGIVKADVYIQDPIETDRYDYQTSVDDISFRADVRSKNNIEVCMSMYVLSGSGASPNIPYLNVKVEEDKLVVETFKDPYYFNKMDGSTGVNVTGFVGSEPIVSIKISNSASGVSDMIYLRVKNSPERVYVDSTIEF